MSETTVVNIRTGATYDVYIGRENGRKRFKRSPWHNPFKIGTDGDRDEVIEKYRDYLWSRPDLMARLPELRGKVLGCWCKEPDRDVPCHGDVLARLADEAVSE